MKKKQLCCDTNFRKKITAFYYLYVKIVKIEQLDQSINNQLQNKAISCLSSL